MATTPLVGGGAVEIIPTRYQTQSTPNSSSPSVATLTSAVVRTLVTYAGTVTAVTLRMWVRNPNGGGWHRAANSATVGPLTPGSINEALDWYVGRNADVTFTVEAISPGTTGNTVAVDVIGVEG